ncbi:tetratricopeptide repeat protein [candidate division WOR-3 bacterium]|nr:tetratricopeptide repeat protein [candidate division WOR-3 bacterium]
MDHSTRRVLILVLIALAWCTHCSSKTEHIRIAREYINEWNYDRALTELIAYRKQRDTEIQYLIGYCYLKKNQYDEAALYFATSLNSSSEYRDSIIAAYNTLANNALRIEEPHRALLLYQEIAKLIPDYDQTTNLFIVANLNFEQGNFPGAREAYVKALEKDSASAQARKARYRYITCLKECDSLDHALELATVQYEALKTSANLLLLNEIRYMIGTQAFAQGLMDSAEVFFQTIIDMQEPRTLLDASYFYMGEILLARNDADGALSMYKKVLRLNPYEKGELVQKAKDRIEELKERS